MDVSTDQKGFVQDGHDVHLPQHKWLNSLRVSNKEEEIFYVVFVSFAVSKMFPCF